MNLVANIDSQGQMTHSKRKHASMRSGSRTSGTEWGLTMHNLRLDDRESFIIDVDVKTAANLTEAIEMLDNFREAILPRRNYGITIWNMREPENIHTPSPR